MSTGEAVPHGGPLPARPSRHGLAVALAHELPPAALMLLACVSGSAAALCGSAVALAALSIGYARAARTSAFAREHVVDLWAMLLVMVAAAFAGVPGGGAASAPSAPSALAGLATPAGAAGHQHLASAPSALALALAVVAVGGWLVARLLLARRTLRAHTVVSAAVCGGMLAAMALM